MTLPIMEHGISREDDMDDFSSLGIKTIATESSVLVSSSRFLNNAQLREALPTALLRRNGHDRRVGWDSTGVVRGFREARDVDHVNALIKEERKINPRFDAWLSERFMSTYKRDDFKSCAKGTLGAAFYDYLIGLNLELDLDPKLRKDPNWRPESDLEFIELRASQTHDFDHLLGGCGIDALDEVTPFWMRIESYFAHLSPELAANLAQVHVLLIQPMLTRTILHYPLAWTTVIDLMQRGIEIGRKADAIFMTRYEEYFDKPMDEVRKALNFPPIGEKPSTELSAYFREMLPASALSPEARHTARYGMAAE